MSIKLIRKDNSKRIIEVWEDKEPDWSHAPDDAVILAIDDWVHDNEIGYRISYNGWRMYTESGVSAFILKWQPI